MIHMKTIITIGRQFGSGGHEIGEKLADHYKIKCFDKELLTRAAKESGFCEEMLRNHDERPTNSFLYNLVMDTYTFGYNSSSFVDMPISHKVFMAQFDTKVERIMRKYEVDADKAREMMVKKDRQRQSYYNYYSTKKWGRSDSYDLSINSSILGVDGTVKLLIQYIEDFEAKNQ